LRKELKYIINYHKYPEISVSELPRNNNDVETLRMSLEKYLENLLCSVIDNNQKKYYMLNNSILRFFRLEQNLFMDSVK